MKLLLHPTTEKIAAVYLQDPPHALLITGAHGVGASSLAQQSARQLSKNIITVWPEKDEVVDLEKGTITIGLVRKLYEQTRTSIDSRVVIIDYAERMAPAAQNAFLKLLEEPTRGTKFIMVSHEPSKLLPTILSRVQRLDMQQITREQSQTLLDTLAVTDPTKRSQLIYIAAGLPAEITRLASDQTYFEKSALLVRDAKQFLQGDTYAKLQLAHKYKDDRAACLRLLDVAMNMLRQSLTANPQTTTTNKLDLLIATYDRIAANGNVRLQLARAVL